MRCDYKFWYVRRDDNGFIIEAAVKFFLGDYEMVNILDEAGSIKETKQLYVRTQRLSPVNLPMYRTIQDTNGNYAFKFTDKDFGSIKTDAELISFCNAKLAQVTTIISATPVTIQT